MSTGIESPTELVSELAALLDRGTAGLVGGSRLAGPAAPQDLPEELVPDLSTGCVGIGLVYEDDVVVSIMVTKALAMEIAAEATPAALQTGLSTTISELAGGRPTQVTQLIGLENERDLIEFLGGRPSLVGAGVFDGEIIAATFGAAGALPVAEEPVAAPSVAPEVPRQPVAQAAAAAPAPAAQAAAPAAAPAQGGEAAPAASAGVGGEKLARGLALLADVNLEVTAELGRTRLRVSELLGLEPGSVIGLEREAGSPVDLLVNGTLFARAEVIVVENQYAVRITELVGGGVSQ